MPTEPIFQQEYNRTKFLDFLKKDFLPDDFEERQDAVEWETKHTYSKRATKLGICDSLDLVVYEIVHTGKEDPRVGLSKEAFRMLTEEWQNRALVLFIPENNPSNYRFSLIEIQLEGDTTSPKIHRRYSNPRRYSYLLGKGIGAYTPNKYLAKGKIKDKTDLFERFSVEVLTKAFYSELSDWYAWAVKVIRFPNNINDNADDNKFNHECVIRLITRLIFVWFLKQKNLVPVEFFDATYLQKLIVDFNPNVQSNESRYYKAILQNLFFAMLNSPITPEGKSDVIERRFSKGRSDHDNNKLMRYEALFINPQLFVDMANTTVPFLNGGLFDCLDDKKNGLYIDAFSDRKEVSEKLIVPDYLFLGDEVGKAIDLSSFYGDAKKKKVSTRGIIDILKRYNFTIEENTPFDQDVSLDPELLGKVFENLLASYNPETKTTARKQTGSFYTPREIVQYMVDESLVAHLKRTVGEELESEYRQLMRYTDEKPYLTNEQKEKIIRALFDCKVLDPACGSGAFPVGMLQQMVHILTQLDPDNTKWQEILMQNAIDETSEAYKTSSNEDRKENIADIERSFNENYNAPDYARKLYLIEHAIFGVDIQPIAVQIAKLRFFISLVVDQKPNEKPEDNFGIRPLPNLEAKFVAANTLIGLNTKNTQMELTNNENVKKIVKELGDAKHKIFGAKTSKTKKKYKEFIESLHKKLASILGGFGALHKDEIDKLAAWNMFDQNSSAPLFNPELMFGGTGVFDIVIGNPPYLKEGRASKSVFDGLRNAPYYQGKMDLWYMFACYGLEFLSTHGILCFIATNNWVTNSGASIMRRKIVTETKILQLCDFSSLMLFESASIQTMVMLFEKNKKDDHYEIDYRRLIGNSQQSDIRSLLSKTKTAQTEYLAPIFNRQSFIDKYIIFSPHELLLNKIRNVNNIIYLTNQEVANGIHSHYDFVNNKIAERSIFKAKTGIFGLSHDEKQKLHLSKEEETLVKPYYYDSELVDRYYTHPKHQSWIIYTDSTFKDPSQMNNYPNLKKHLDKFTNIITSDNKPYGLHRARDERFFKGEKVIALRKCAGRPLFSYSDFDCYLSATFYVIKTNRVDMKYLTALLNSKLIKFWLKNRGKMQGQNYQLDKEPLVSIPIATPSKEIQQKIATLVEYIIWLKANPNDPINNYVNNDYVSEVIEGIVDAIIFECYFSSEFKTKSIEISSLIYTNNNVSEFYKNIKNEGSILLNQIKLMKVELAGLLMPILSV